MAKMTRGRKLKYHPYKLEVGQSMWMPEAILRSAIVGASRWSKKYGMKFVAESRDANGEAIRGPNNEFGVSIRRTE
jgi:hypothetical protein